MVSNIRHRDSTSISSSKWKEIQRIEVQALFPNSTLEINNSYVTEFSGKYKEVPAILTMNNTIHKYVIEEIYFLFTTNTKRIQHTIHFVKFWAQFPSIKCLIVFEQNDFITHRNITRYLIDEGIPCKVQSSNVRRFQERYLQLIAQSWNNLETYDTDMKKVQWFAVCDDDTVWFINNLLHTLRQYNSSEKIYLGDYSDRISNIRRFGTYYAYGGGGAILSRPLAYLFAKHIQECKRFTNMYGGDEMIGKCITEILKVKLTRNSNFHQMDNRGDMTGLFESGIDGLVSLHHMFSSWKPFPNGYSDTLSETMSLLKLAYQTFDKHFLKRYVRINYKTNQTLLLTMGYSFSLFNRILSHAELTQVENTWCCRDMMERKTRPTDNNKTTWYFRRLNSKTSARAIGRGAVYENKKKMYGHFSHVEVTLMN
jgi:hypothetical protein